MLTKLNALSTLYLSMLVGTYIYLIFNNRNASLTCWVFPNILNYCLTHETDAQREREREADITNKKEEREGE